MSNDITIPQSLNNRLRHEDTKFVTTLKTSRDKYNIYYDYDIQGEFTNVFRNSGGDFPRYIEPINVKFCRVKLIIFSNTSI